MDGPGAGPSKPRSPPATPHARSRSRRSWFGLGSPTPTPSSSAPPLHSTNVKNPASFPSSATPEEDDVIELASVQDGAVTESGAKGGAAAGEEGKAPGEGYMEELLTIDGDPEATVKKKKKKRSNKGGEEDGEVMRLQDLSGRSSLQSTSGMVRRSSEERKLPFDSPENMGTPPFRPTTGQLPRTSTPVHSDQGADADQTPRLSQTPLLASVPPRTSSMLKTPSPPSVHIIFSDKPQPPPPLDRPLPPLPPEDADTRTPPQRHQPEIPRGIVVTPSSPRKLIKTPRSASRSASSTKSELTTVDRRRTRSASRSRESRDPSASSESRESSRTSQASSGRTSPIGLGLPSHVVQGAQQDDMPPPPLPPKSQSVSSPHPSRLASPAPKISFTETPSIREATTPDPTSSAARVEEERKARVKRARSLSGIFSRASPAVTAQKPIESLSSEPTTPDVEEVIAESSATGAAKLSGSGGGVLEWLGMRKSSKRRLSESKTKEVEAAEESAGVAAEDAEAENPKGRDERNASKESLGLGEAIATVEDGTRPRRPKLRTETSETTITPAHPGKISAFFARRPSAKTGNTQSESTPQLPVPEAQHTPDTAGLPEITSSNSSISLPPIDIPLPGLLRQNAPWISSPTSENEELLSSPPNGPNWGPGIRPWMDETNSARPRSSASSPLGEVKERGSLEVPAPLAPVMSREGRARSWSDAPQPSPGVLPPGDGLSTHRGTDQAGSKSLQASPLTPSRPKMGSRSNSGNTTISRMKTVFSKSTSRNRSNSLLQPGSSDVDEFGGIRGRSNTVSSARMRPSTSSSYMSSPAPPRSPRSGVVARNVSLLDLVDGERQAAASTSQRSPRSSSSGTMSSNATGSTWASAGTSRSTLTDSMREPGTARAARARASTVSFMSSAPQHSSPLVSPNLHAIGTSPRHRPSAISRFSSGLFSGPSSPRSNSLFPLPSRSSGSSSSATGISFGALEDPVSTIASPGTSPRPSVGSIAAVTAGASSKQLCAREGDEPAAAWLIRVSRAIGRDQIAGVLAVSGDEFHSEALQLYMSRFDFTHDSLDVALRRLLMQMSLPKETQQIDRVIEAFANRYEQCEPGLFKSKDNTYVLAFSMMMLHTDAFNKNNKNKMTKDDYVRNTRLDGVPPFALKAFFDNITFTPFVFIEDDADLERSATSGLEGMTISSPMGTAGLTTSVSASKAGKIDVYDMIVRGLLPSCRVDVESEIPAESPFSCLGTRPILDMEGLHHAFTHAHSLQISTSAARRHGTSVVSEKVVARGLHEEGEIILKVTKVGLISRRNDGAESSKKTRKWKSYSVILTGSQLLFFKDPIWALTLLEQARTASAANGHALLPKMTTFKPDEVFPVQDCFAVYDRELSKTPTTFRFIMPHGRQYIMQASDTYEMNEWIALINYASTFKTAGIRIRSSGLAKDQAVLAGAAAAASHKREVQESSRCPSGEHPRMAKVKTVFGEPAEMSSEVENRADRSEPAVTLPMPIAAKSGQEVLELNGADQVVGDEGERLGEVFDTVKAELAAGRGGAPMVDRNEAGQVNGNGLNHYAPRAHLSRADTIDKQIRRLEAEATPLERRLRENLRLARNLAILTPFQKFTRDQLAAAVSPIARQIRADRLTLSKYRIWTTILKKDAERDGREWARVRHVALQAAARSLRDPKGVRAIVEDAKAGSVSMDGTISVPKLSLPPGDGGEAAGEEQAGEGLDTSPREMEERSDRSPGEMQERLDRSPGELDQDSATDTPRLGASPAELPIMFRRPSDDLPAVAGAGSGGGPSRPVMSRHASAGSFRSPEIRSPPRSSSYSGLRRSSSDLLSAKIQYEERGGGDASPGSWGTPMLFTLEHEEGLGVNAEAEKGQDVAQEAQLASRSSSRIGESTRNGNGGVNGVYSEDAAERNGMEHIAGGDSDDLANVKWNGAGHARDATDRTIRPSSRPTMEDDNVSAPYKEDEGVAVNAARQAVTGGP